jgi:hypothetical protein
LTDQLTITEYRDWLVFVERLNEAVASGRVRRIPVTKTVYLKNEQWFLDPATDEVYVYVAPDSPILPIWEKVDVLRLDQPTGKEHSREVGHANQANLKVFTVGKISPAEAQSVRVALDILIRRGLVRVLEPYGVSVSEGSTERWFQDNGTKAVYRLIERNNGEIRWERVPQTLLRGQVH